MLNKILTSAGLLACVLTTAGCYEKGFEYQTKTSLKPVDASGVSGSAIMGPAGESHFRLRIALRGLGNNVEYQIRFFAATGCDDRDLAQAHRIDGVRGDVNKSADEWGFDLQPVSLTGGLIGTVEKDFLLGTPTAPSIYGGMMPDKYPTIVIYALVSEKRGAEPRLERVACGTISSPPSNQRPHT